MLARALSGFSHRQPDKTLAKSSMGPQAGEIVGLAPCPLGTDDVHKGAAVLQTVMVPANSVKIITLPWDNTLKGPSSLNVVPFPASVRVNAGAYRLR